MHPLSLWADFQCVRQLANRRPKVQSVIGGFSYNPATDPAQIAFARAASRLPRFLYRLAVLTALPTPSR